MSQQEILLQCSFFQWSRIIDKFLTAMVAVQIPFNLQQNKFVTKKLMPEVANSLEENMT